MAARFWVGGSGNWDASTTTHWSTSTGGSGGAAVPTTSDTVTFDANSGSATITITATANCSTLTSSSANNSLSPGTNTINVAGGGAAWTWTAGTYTTSTETISLTGAGITFAGGGKTYHNVSITGSGVATITGTNTFSTLTRTGTAVVGDSIVFPGGATTTCTNLTINGNSTKNRLLVNTSNVYTGRATISVSTTITASYVDFHGIKGAGAASWNLASITGGSGDYSDNNSITLTTAQSNYWSSGTGNFSTTANWYLATNGGGGAGRIPLPQDTAILDSNSFTAGSQTLTLDMPRLGALTCTGVTNSPTVSVSLAIGFVGNITLASGMTLALGANTLSANNYITAQSWTTAGATITATTSGLISVNPGLGGPTLTFEDNLTTPGGIQSSTASFTAANNVTITANSISLTTLGAWNLGTGVTWVATGTGTVLNILDTGVTAGTGTIKVTDTSSTTKTLALGGNTFYNMTLSGGSGTIAITGANTFNNLTINAPATLVTFPISTTQTFTTFNALGSSGNTITINSSTNNTQHTLSAASGVISCNYLVLRDSNAIGGAAWYAGANSTSTADNSGWIFANAPSTALTGNFLDFM